MYELVLVCILVEYTKWIDRSEPVNCNLQQRFHRAAKINNNFSLFTTENVTQSQQENVPSTKHFPTMAIAI